MRVYISISALIIIDNGQILHDDKVDSTLSAFVTYSIQMPFSTHQNPSFDLKNIYITIQ
jgi:hypothetical protein